MDEYNINKIALAAINTLPVEKSYEYIRELIKDDTFEQIENKEFIIEVNMI